MSFLVIMPARQIASIDIPILSQLVKTQPNLRANPQNTQVSVSAILKSDFARGCVSVSVGVTVE